MRNVRRTLIGVAAAAGLPHVSAAQQGWFSIDTPGANILASSISEDGRYVTGIAQATGMGGFRWSVATGAVPLEPIPTWYGVSPTKVSASGQWVAGRHGSGVPFLWDETGGVRILGGTAGMTYTPRWVSDSGDLIVGYAQNGSSTYSGFSWRPGTGTQTFSIPGVTEIELFAASRDGLTFVGHGLFADEPGPYKRRAFRWRESTGTVKLEGQPQDRDTYVIGASGDLTSVVGVSDGGMFTRRAFLWRQGFGLTLIPPLAGEVQSYATSVSSDGTLVGGTSQTIAQHETAIVWSPEGGTRTVAAYLAEQGVQVPGATTLYLVTAMSGDGQTLLINGTLPSSGARAFVARLCYPNCDLSTTPPVLSANDFLCYLNMFASGNPAANCDHSTRSPILNINDFQCFLNRFASGCL